MTKNQQREIAKMWMGSMMQNCGVASIDLDEDCSIDDAHSIVEECEKLGEKMLGNRPLLHSLPTIIGWVLSNKK